MDVFEHVQRLDHPAEFGQGTGEAKGAGQRPALRILHRSSSASQVVGGGGARRRAPGCRSWWPVRARARRGRCHGWPSAGAGCLARIGQAFILDLLEPLPGQDQNRLLVEDGLVFSHQFLEALPLLEDSLALQPHSSSRNRLQHIHHHRRYSPGPQTCRAGTGDRQRRTEPAGRRRTC